MARQWEEVLFRLLLRILEAEVGLRESVRDRSVVRGDQRQVSSIGKRLEDVLPVLESLQAVLTLADASALAKVQEHFFDAMCRLQSLAVDDLWVGDLPAPLARALSKLVVTVADCSMSFASALQSVVVSGKSLRSALLTVSFTLPFVGQHCAAPRQGGETSPADLAVALSPDGEHAATVSFQLAELLLRQSTSSPSSLGAEDLNGLLPPIVLGSVTAVHSGAKALAAAAAGCLFSCARRFASHVDLWRSCFPGVFSSLSKLVLQGSNRSAGLLSHALLVCLELLQSFARDDNDENAALAAWLEVQAVQSAAEEGSAAKAAFFRMVRAASENPSNLDREISPISRSVRRRDMSSYQKWRVDLLQRVTAVLPVMYRKVVEQLNGEQQQTIGQTLATLLSSSCIFLSARFCAELLCCLASQLVDASGYIRGSLLTRTEDILRGIAQQHPRYFVDLTALLSERWREACDRTHVSSLQLALTFERDLSQLLGIAVLMSRAGLASTSLHSREKLRAVLERACLPDLNERAAAILESRRFVHVTVEFGAVDERGEKSLSLPAAVEVQEMEVPWLCARLESLRCHVRALAVVAGSSASFRKECIASAFSRLQRLDMRLVGSQVLPGQDEARAPQEGREGSARRMMERVAKATSDLRVVRCMSFSSVLMSGSVQGDSAGQLSADGTSAIPLDPQQILVSCDLRLCPASDPDSISFLDDAMRLYLQALQLFLSAEGSPRAANAVPWLAVLAAVAVGGLADLAVVFGASAACHRLQRMIFPLLQAAVAPNALVQMAAKATLTRLSLYLRFPSLAHMLQSQLDVVVDRACLSLRGESFCLSGLGSAGSARNHLVLDYVFRTCQLTAQDSAPTLLRDVVFESLRRVDELAIAPSRGSALIMTMLRMLEVLVTLVPSPAQSIAAAMDSPLPTSSPDSGPFPLRQQQASSCRPSWGTEYLQSLCRFDSGLLAMAEKEQTARDDGDVAQDGNDGADEKVTASAKLLRDVLDRLVFLLKCPMLNTQLLVLEIAGQVLVRLQAEGENAFLPAVHKIWNALMLPLVEQGQRLRSALGSAAADTSIARGSVEPGRKRVVVPSQRLDVVDRHGSSFSNADGDPRAGSIAAVGRLIQTSGQSVDSSAVRAVGRFIAGALGADVDAAASHRDWYLLPALWEALALLQRGAPQFVAARFAEHLLPECTAALAAFHRRFVASGASLAARSPFSQESKLKRALASFLVRCVEERHSAAQSESLRALALLSLQLCSSDECAEVQEQGLGLLVCVSRQDPAFCASLTRAIVPRAEDPHSIVSSPAVSPQHWLQLTADPALQILGVELVGTQALRRLQLDKGIARALSHHQNGPASPVQPRRDFHPPARWLLHLTRWSSL